MIDVPDLQALDNYDVTVGDVINVGGFSGGIFIPNLQGPILTASKIVLRFLPHCHTARLVVTGGGIAEETFTIGSYEIEFVAWNTPLPLPPNKVRIANPNLVADHPASYQLATNIISHINLNSVALGVRARSSNRQSTDNNVTTYSAVIFVYANIPVPVGAIPLAQSDPGLKWTRANLSSATNALWDPVDDSTIHFGSEIETFVSTLTSGKVLIGSTPTKSAQNLKVRLDLREPQLEFRCDISGMELTLTPNNQAGLKRLQTLRKGQD